MDIYAKRALKGFVIAVVILVTGYFTFNFIKMQKIKKEFIEKTYEFAEYTAAGDLDNIDKMLSVDWWKYKDNSALSNEDNARIFRIIQDSFTYEVQEDTLEMDKYHCSVTVSFTRLDYLSIYLSLEDVTADEYIDALENSDKTVTIDVVFSYNMPDGWHPATRRINDYFSTYETETDFYGFDDNFDALVSFYSTIPLFQKLDEAFNT